MKKNQINCVHHWGFPAPTGPTSIGVCKKCGEKQEAENHMQTSAISSFRMKSMKRKRNPPAIEVCTEGFLLEGDVHA